MNARKRSCRPAVSSALVAAMLWVAASAGAAIAGPTLQLARTIKTNPFVSSSVSQGNLETETATFVQAARRLGYTVQEATRLVEEAWTA